MVALDAHSGQHRRCGERVPYVVHPVHVAFMLARLGLDETTVVAALLHDVAEDADGWDTGRIEAEFGTEVASIVTQLTEDKSQSWEERKQAAIDGVPHLCGRALAVKAADKLHNLESLVFDLDHAADPDEVWGRFSGGRAGTLRIAREVVAQLLPRLGDPLADALRATLARLEVRA